MSFKDLSKTGAAMAAADTPKQGEKSNPQQQQGGKDAPQQQGGKSAPPKK